MNSARKPIIPLDTAVILRIETEIIANILPKNFSGIFFALLILLKLLRKEFQYHEYTTKSLTGS